MQNVLFIVLDSITNNQIFNNIVTPAPFLKNLKEHSITGDNMYSQAPYTEAALMSLLGSLDTMDYNGYLEKFKNKTSVIDVFKENNYKTFFSSYYPTIYPSYVYYGASEYRYVELFNFSQVWEYRLSYFKDFYLNNETTDEENSYLIDLLGDNIMGWIKILELIKENDERTEMINDCVRRDNVDFIIKQLNEEEKLFNNNKKEYLTNLFLESTNHKLFKIYKTVYKDKVQDDEFRKWFLSEYKFIFKKINKLQINRNLRNAKFPVKKFVLNLNNKKIAKGIIAGYKNLIFDKDLMDRINENYDLFKMQRSFRTVMDVTKKWILKNKDNKWMAYVHIDDAHYPESFFTYDTNDKSIVKKEINILNQFLNNIPKNYCGTIASDLSLLYCDTILEELFCFLESNHILDNTSVVITADHGFSYYFNPIREKYVISSYKENYNVPFIIYNKNIIPKKIEGYLATKDIPTTLLDLAGLSIPSTFKGKSLLNFNGRKYATLEFMGGGCPDIKRRPIMLGVRTENFSVVTDAYVYKNKNSIIIKEVYDLKKDPFEHINLYNKNCDISYELGLIRKRYNEIKKGINK